MTLRNASLAVLCVTLLMAPKAAAACAVCMAGNDEANRDAFLITTGLLSVLPPALIGGAVWWLRKRARALHEHAEARALGTAAATARTRSTATASASLDPSNGAS